MAHFYSSIKGRSDIPRTCTGTKNSGIRGHIRGWNLGAKVDIRYNEKTNKDEVWIYKTGGSNGTTNDEIVAFFTEE